MVGSIFKNLEAIRFRAFQIRVFTTVVSKAQSHLTRYLVAGVVQFPTTRLRTDTGISLVFDQSKGNNLNFSFALEPSNVLECEQIL